MSYKELEFGYQGLRAASFYIGDDTENNSPSSVSLLEAGLGETLPTTYDYVYTSSTSPTKTVHPNCPICLRVVSTVCLLSHHQYSTSCNLVLNLNCFTYSLPRVYTFFGCGLVISVWFCCLCNILYYFFLFFFHSFIFLFLLVSFFMFLLSDSHPLPDVV